MEMINFSKNVYILIQNYNFNLNLFANFIKSQLSEKKEDQDFCRLLVTKLTISIFLFFMLSFLYKVIILIHPKIDVQWEPGC